MSDKEKEYEEADELVTSHSDENPELETGERSPLCAYTTEGSAVSQLYDQDKDSKKRRKGLLGVRDDEHLLEYEDSEGNYYYYD
jgi:hypothetical protein